jgi:hypothetical protein
MARPMTSCWICSVPSKMSMLSLACSGIHGKSLTRPFSPAPSADSAGIRPVLVPN